MARDHNQEWAEHMCEKIAPQLYAAKQELDQARAALESAKV